MWTTIGHVGYLRILLAPNRALRKIEPIGIARRRPHRLPLRTALLGLPQLSGYAVNLGMGWQSEGVESPPRGRD
jgi:hypothetical protein